MTRGPVLPGATIGIVGGGQLGRMFGIAARRLGYRVAAFDPGRDCPTGQVADVEVNAAFDDLDAARAFARSVDVVTYEFENIPPETLAVIQEHAEVRPSPELLAICRHRRREKEFLTRAGVPVAEYAVVHDDAEMGAAFARLGRSIAKTATLGYDGKGQVSLRTEADARAAFSSLGGQEVVVEKFVPFACEISVVLARTAQGEIAPFAVFENAHVDGVLDVTVAPARVPEKVATDAVEIARRVAEASDLVGVLAVELFVLDDGALLVNELAPRPHNSGHLTFDAALTSQFEQQLRAVCGLPLGAPDLLCPAAMANILGDAWGAAPPPTDPRFAAALAEPRAKLHLYGKAEARPGRKMGHITALHPAVDEAEAIARRARAALTGAH